MKRTLLALAIVQLLVAIGITGVATMGAIAALMGGAIEIGIGLTAVSVVVVTCMLRP